MRRPSLYTRCALLLALLLGLLAPVATLALGHGEPLVGVCRSPDAEGRSGALPHGWFDHCATCGALGQSLGDVPAQLPWGPSQLQPIVGTAEAPPHAVRVCVCAPPPPRGPPTQH